MVFPAEARQPGASESAGLATGDETKFSDGRKVGEVTYRFGARATVTRDMPGWFIADGTQPIDLIVAGVNYGKPNLTGRMIVGANDDAGGGGTFPVNATGGSTTLAAHTHEFTQPSAHSITQPIVGNHSTISHTANHTGTALLSHSTHTGHTDHPGTQAELLVTPGSGVWINTYNSSANAAAARTHDHNHDAHDNNHTVFQPDAHGDHTPSAHALTTDVALTNNHSGGAVGAVSGASASPLPPYISLYPLIKLR